MQDSRTAPTVAPLRKGTSTQIGTLFWGLKETCGRMLIFHDGVLGLGLRVQVGQLCK